MMNKKSMHVEQDEEEGRAHSGQDCGTGVNTQGAD